MCVFSGSFNGLADDPWAPKDQRGDAYNYNPGPRYNAGSMAGICVCTYIHTHTRIHTHTHAHMYMHPYTHTTSGGSGYPNNDGRGEAYG